MRDEYDFTNAVRGNHAAQYRQGIEIAIDGEPEEAIVLDADVKAAFSDSVSVNAALRLLIQTAERARPAAAPVEKLEKAS